MTNPATQFKKGKKSPLQGKRGPGKVTKELKEMILGALDDCGGQDYLKTQAESNPNAFLGLVGKVLPQTINANVNLLDKFGQEGLAALEAALTAIKGRDS